MSRIPEILMRAQAVTCELAQMESDFQHKKIAQVQQAVEDRGGLTSMSAWTLLLGAAAQGVLGIGGLVPGVGPLLGQLSQVVSLAAQAGSKAIEKDSPKLELAQNLGLTQLQKEKEQGQRLQGALDDLVRKADQVGQSRMQALAAASR